MGRSLAGTRATGSLLFVRAYADVRRAVTGVNELLSRRPTHGTPEDDLLGILVCGDVEAVVPTPTYEGAPSSSGALALRECAGLYGIWNLCSFDLGVVEAAWGAERRRTRLLDALVLVAEVGGSQPGAVRPQLLPVVTPREARQELDRLVSALEARYPALTVGPDAFVVDPARGGLVSSNGRGLPSGLGGLLDALGVTPQQPLSRIFVQKISRHNIDN